MPNSYRGNIYHRKTVSLNKSGQAYGKRNNEITEHKIFARHKAEENIKLRKHEDFKNPGTISERCYFETFVFGNEG